MPIFAAACAVDITPFSPAFLEGYHSRDHAHERVHDHLQARVLYLRGDAADAILVSADCLWFYDALVERLGLRLEKSLAVDKSHIFLCATHTHSAPYTGGEHANPEWVARLEAEIVSAAATAKNNLRPASLRVGRGRCSIGMNRRQVMSDGSIQLGCNPDGPIDRELVKVALQDDSGRIIAQVANFACHGVVLGPGNYDISADWMGVAAREIETESNAPFLFINGGSGNIDPIVRVQTSFEPVERLGREFVEAFKGIPLAEVESDTTVKGMHLPIELPRKQKHLEDGRGRMRKTFVSGLRMGPVKLVGFKGEIFTETALAVKSASETGTVLVCSYVNGDSGGYVPTADAWELGGYEVRVSLYSSEAESVIRQKFIELTTQL